MQLGMIGLGRMGGNMARRPMSSGHEVVVYSATAKTREAFAKETGAFAAASLEELVATLRQPRAVWLMVPAAVVHAALDDLAGVLKRGDILIDGGNSHYVDDIRRAKALAAAGIHYVDCGTSGGIWGLERGYCLMIGGEETVIRHLEPLFSSLAPGPGTLPRTPGRGSVGGTAEHGYLHCGPAGAGHFVKMIHNGIEYGLMQAYAEGLDVLRGAFSMDLPEDLRYQLNIADIAELWRRGSVVSSWLLDLTAQALAEDPGLSNYTGFVQDSGEGR